MTGPSFQDWMREIQARTEQALTQKLPEAHTTPTQLHSAMRYATLGGGKRVRPLLVHAAGMVSHAQESALDACAIALEFIHVYSLVHDDMPCMDDDVLRRGKPTVHIAYDEATALLVGDALQALAFQTLTEIPSLKTTENQLEMVRLLAQAGGSRGMVGGQAVDLSAVGQTLTLSELEYMHIHKTGALIRCAVRLGLLCGEVPIATTEALDHYGKLVGLLFQVVDDILDAKADTATLGKTAGKDAVNQKPTYVSLLGLGAAQQLANDMLDEALSLLAPLGPPAQRLRELAQYIVHRPF